jgi:predicted unusual protein kinase regulating ubiquinone biosynthesis (AarF/ABC1/UbiB family)
MRAVVILWRLGPLVLSFIRDHRRWLVAGRGAERSAAFHRRRAQRLLEEVTALGPTFIKLAQVFGSRADLIPEPYVGALTTLTDSVAPVPTPAIRAEIARAFGRPPDALFERFDDAPIAAASLGQVHRARWRGEEIVVKVLRPGVERLVRHDLAVAMPLVRWLSRRYPTPHVRNARTVIEEYTLKIGEEMDFVREAGHATRIRANFRDNRKVIVPRVIPELVSRHVLGLEYLEGTRIDRVHPGRGDSAGDPRGVVSSVMELYLQMMLVDGVFHADPHPGNLLVAPDGRVILLDFGMVVDVPRGMRWHLVTTVFAAIRRDVDGIIAGFQSLGLIVPGADMGEIRRLAGVLMGIAYERTTVNERLELLAQEVLETLYDFPIQLPSEMVYFARTAALIEGLGTRFDPRFNAITFATPIALRMRSRILSSLRDDRGASPLDMATVVGTALGHVAGLLAGAGRRLLRWANDAPARDAWRPALPAPAVAIAPAPVPTLLAGD